MICIHNTYTDTHFNLAAEEYLLKNHPEELFMLYRNEPSVVVGKFQYVPGEVNLDFIRKNNVKLARRISGGGTVYHDLGNLNLTFIASGSPVDFDSFHQRMVSMLAAFGIEAGTDERRALYMHGLKISGSAQRVHKGRAMYHATLLFSSDLHHLTSALAGDPEQPESISGGRVYVKSIKSPVSNIADQLDNPPDIIRFMEFILGYFLQEKEGNKLYDLSGEDKIRIDALAEKKYRTLEWNYLGKEDGMPRKGCVR